MKKNVAIAMSAVMLSGCTLEVRKKVNNAWHYQELINDEILAIGYAKDEVLKEKLIIAGNKNSYIIDNKELFNVLKTFNFNNLVLADQSYTDLENKKVGNYLKNPVSDSIEQIQNDKSEVQRYALAVNGITKKHTFKTSIRLVHFKPTSELTMVDTGNLSKFQFTCQTIKNIHVCTKDINLNVTVAQRANNVDSFEYKFAGKRYISIYSKKIEYAKMMTGYLQYPLAITFDLVVLPAGALLWTGYFAMNKGAVCCAIGP